MFFNAILLPTQYAIQHKHVIKHNVTSLQATNNKRKRSQLWTNTRNIRTTLQGGKQGDHSPDTGKFPEDSRHSCPR